MRKMSTLNIVQKKKKNDCQRFVLNVRNVPDFRSYYTGEVPKVMFELSADIKTELEKELHALKKVLNIKDLLINIGEW